MSFFGFLAEDVWFNLKDSLILKHQILKANSTRLSMDLKAPHAWFNRLKNKLVAWDFSHSKYDLFLFLFRSRG